MTPHLLITTNSSALFQSVCPDLINAGYQVIQTANGQETLSIMANQDNLDLVLLDTPLVDMDGIRLARQIRCLSNYLFIPIILVVSKKSKTLESERR